MLHILIPPTTKKVHKVGNKKQITKYTIGDSEESFFICKKTVGACEEHINILQLKGENIQPFIIIIGDNLFEPKEILVYFDSIKYKLFSILDAINCCFQIFHVFNLSYPLPSQAIWMFVQKYLYSLTTPLDVPFYRVTQVINDLKN